MTSGGGAYKRVLFLGFSPQPGGAELQMLSLIDKLDPTRFQAIVALAEDGPLSNMLHGRAQNVAIVPSMRALLRGVGDLPTLASNIASLLPTLLALRRLIIEQSVDLIHAYAEPTVKYAAVLRSLTGLLTLCTFHEASVPARNRMHRAGLVAALTHGIDTIISPSRAAATGLIDGGIPAKRVTVVHNGVDLARFSVTEEIRVRARRLFGVCGDEPIVTLTARFTRMKGHDVLLRAVASLRDRGRRIRVIIAGKPLFGGEHEWHEEIRRLLLTLGLEAQVTLIGWLDDLAPLYAASDIVVHPCTLADTLPSAVLEAMAASRPVVASCIGGLPELVVDDHTGLLVEPGNPVALANAILELIDQPEKAKRLGLNARHRAVTHFDQGRYAETLMAIYDRHLR